MASHRRLKDSLSKEIKRAEERGRAAASAKTSSPLRPRTRSRGLPPSSNEDSNVNESFGTPIGTPLNLLLNEEEPDETIMPLNPPLTTTPATTAATVVVTAAPPIAPTLGCRISARHRELPEATPAPLISLKMIGLTSSYSLVDQLSVEPIELFVT
jgi:hypothetical protein